MINSEWRAGLLRTDTSNTALAGPDPLAVQQFSAAINSMPALSSEALPPADANGSLCDEARTEADAMANFRTNLIDQSIRASIEKAMGADTPDWVDM